MSSKRQVRLQREMKFMAKKSKPGVYLGPKGDSLDEFEASITGVEGTPYENGVFKLEVKVSESYPFTPPSIRFITEVYHPNIDTSGRICLKTLKPSPAGDWTPSLTILDVVSEVRLLLKHPNTNDSLMTEIADEYNTDRERFNEKAREMTLKYACKNCNKTEDNKEAENTDKNE